MLSLLVVVRDDSRGACDEGSVAEMAGVFLGVSGKRCVYRCWACCVYVVLNRVLIFCSRNFVFKVVAGGVSPALGLVSAHVPFWFLTRHECSNETDGETVLSGHSGYGWRRYRCPRVWTSDFAMIQGDDSDLWCSLV